MSETHTTYLLSFTSVSINCCTNIYFADANANKDGETKKLKIKNFEIPTKVLASWTKQQLRDLGTSELQAFYFQIFHSPASSFFIIVLVGFEMRDSSARNASLYSFHFSIILLNLRMFSRFLNIIYNIIYIGLS